MRQWFCLLVLFCASAGAHARDLVLNPDESATDVASYIEYFVDETNDLTPSEAITRKFSLNTRSSFNIGLSVHTIWIDFPCSTRVIEMVSGCCP